LHRTGTLRDQRPSPAAGLPCRSHSGCTRCSGRRGQRTRSRTARTASHSAEPARDRVCTCSLSSRLPPARSCSCCGDIARTPDLCFRWRRRHVRRTRTRRRLRCDARGPQCTCSLLLADPGADISSAGQRVGSTEPCGQYACAGHCKHVVDTPFSTFATLCVRNFPAAHW
jgi:hypothetical protein